MSSNVLTLDGEAIRLDNMKVGMSFTLADKDASGGSALTASIEEGNKAMTLKVSGTLNFTAQKQLSRLLELARKNDKDGSRHVFRIGNVTARAVKFRQAKFTGEVSVTEQDKLMAWQVSFSLHEENSVAEQQAARTPQPSTATQQVNSAQFSKALTESNKVAL